MRFIVALNLNFRDFLMVGKNRTEQKALFVERRK
jgi:hypothetical protein